MVKLNKIYTRSGDDGTTGLVDGSRRLKHDLRFEVCGTLDEANAQIGLARVHVMGPYVELDDVLSRIQNDLFDLGADMATPVKKGDDTANLRIIAEQVTWLEQQIDMFNERLQPLTSFILPGGNIAAAQLHLARTVVRRAERLTVAMMQNETINLHALHYLNRLSDLIFVLSRIANEEGRQDVLWVPGKNR